MATKQYRSVQYLRGIAAMMVVYFHFLMHLARSGAGVLPDDIKVGAAGVDIFFVISGFVMWVTTYGTNMRPKEFWGRRLARIVPLYWSFTLLLAVLAIVAPVASRTQLEFGHLMTSLFFIPSVHPFKDGQIWPLLVPGWSLNFEMYFYLLFGGCLALSKDFRLPAIALLFVGAVVSGLLLNFENPIALTYSSPIILEFLMGVVIGHLVLKGMTVSAPVALVLILLAVAGFVLGENSEHSVRERLIFWSVPSILLVYAFLSAEQNGFKFENRTMLALGDSSYSLYLSHMFTLGAIGFLWAKTDIQSVAVDLIMHPFALLVCGIVGLAFWKYYEMPLLAIVRRFLRRGSGRQLTATSRADQGAEQSCADWSER